MSQIINSTKFVVVGGRSNQHYSYDGDQYISTFPQEWLLTHDTDDTGPKHCGNCNCYGVWGGIFLGYCRNCAKYKYKGKRGLGFIDNGKELSQEFINTIVNSPEFVNSCLDKQNHTKRLLSFINENECCSASNTYLKGMSFKRYRHSEYIENETKNIIHQSNEDDDVDDDESSCDESSSPDSDMPPLIHIDELRKRRNCIQGCETAISQVCNDKYYDTLNSMNIPVLADEYTSDTDSDMSIGGSKFLQHPLDDEMVDMEVENNVLQSFHNDHINQIKIKIKPLDPMEVSVSESNEYDVECSYSHLMYRIYKGLKDFDEY